ncbi:flagellar biosynthesis regulator FlaF [Roseovarius indicus]|uniref:FlaF protein n=1 Tax=Roseovarius indicus TaxID=540747 RepID=A0A0T5PC53_9RHOB|nr:flagellar biosynthesis regulator FlaF [Roseovarius indicus]KRS18600.1 flaF protein [Roseovarius indicus]QEW25623.1 flagellar biosynthesis regulatory protein FlaF [Roseovarius indicus]SFE01689.1 flagellar protein FlaF [Roseovarius indicus]
MSIAAYKRTISDTEAPRQIERRVLVQVTSRLESGHVDYDAAETSGERLEILSNGLREDVWQNERVWLAFKADLAEPENALSPDLRAGLLSLAMWVERHSQGVLAGEKKVKPLIDINKTIINGLAGRAFSTTE